MPGGYVYVTNIRWSGSPTAAVKVPSDGVAAFLANHPGERVITRGENARRAESGVSHASPEFAGLVNAFTRALREVSAELAPEAPRETARKRDST